MPPTVTTMSPAPSRSSSSISCGTSVLWPPDCVEMPTTCTSFSTAWRATSSGRLEQGADVDVEAEVGEGGGDDLGAAVVPVLADLGDQHARPAAVLGGEALDVGAQRRPLGVVAELAAVDAGDGADLRVVAAPHLLERIGDLADGGARPRRRDGQLEQVALSRSPPRASAPRASRAPRRRRGWRGWS